MKIEIKSQIFEGREYLEFLLHDGPQEREKIRGYATDLIVAFTKIIEWHERIESEYGSGEGIPPVPEGYSKIEAEPPPL
jgi:hypothetical protein